MKLYIQTSENVLLQERNLHYIRSLITIVLVLVLPMEDRKQPRVEPFFDMEAFGLCNFLLI